VTQRLYYTDSYLTEFTGTVLERGDAGRRVYLDRTAFYQPQAVSPMTWDRWVASGCSMSSMKENV